MARSDPNLSSEEAPIDPDLPAQARARVEAERAQAEVEFRSAYRSLKAGSDQEALQQTENLLAAYIHHVFFAFAEEALNSGWPAEAIRVKSERFLPLLVDRTFFVKHPCARVIDRDVHRARFQDWAVFAVQNSDSWVEFQKALAELAQADAHKRPPRVKPGSTPTTRAGNQGGKTAPEANVTAPAQPQMQGTANGRVGAGKEPRSAEAEPKFPARAAWLKQRLLERGWSTSDPYKHRGPDRKTIEKILRGKAVRNDVLEKLATALSGKHAKVDVLDIPQD